MEKIYLDVETRSATDINRGVQNYSADPHFAIILVQWAVGEGPVKLWEPLNEPMPRSLSNLFKTPSDYKWIIFNAQFERTTLRADGYVDLKSEWIEDAMIQALSHALPGSLEALCAVLGLGEDQTKIKDGKRLIKLFTQPRLNELDGDGNPVFLDRHTHPKDWELFREYGRMDVVSMREAHKRMPRWNYPDGPEYDVWLQDQKTADRGMKMDMDLAHAAVATAAEERAELNRLTKLNTGGAVESATKANDLRAHILDEYGIELPNLQRATIEYLMADPETPAPLRELAGLRIDASRNAATKYHPVIRNTAKDGRLRGTLQLFGASRTGRDAGRIFQPQNLMRPTLWRGKEGEALDKAIAYDVEVVKAMAASLTSESVMELLGNLTRSLVVAPKGKKLVIADLSNIEGRGLVWLSGEEWKLQYFRDYDAGKIKYDNYQVAYANAMNTETSTVDRYQRNIGKVMELGLGYGGGVAAFLTFAAVYDLDLTELADAVYASGNILELNECREKYDWAKENGYHGGLPEYEFSACEYLKQKWRAAHPATVNFWRNLEQAFRDSINANGVQHKVRGTGGKLIMLRQGHWLRIRLPSGRSLVYVQPRIEEDGQITFMGRHPYTGRWARLKTYGGRLSENVTSAAARDVMFHNLKHVEEAGYEVILRVHDELVAEVPANKKFSSSKLADLMATPHEWCKDWPLAAAGFETNRYRGGD